MAVSLLVLIHSRSEHKSIVTHHLSRRLHGAAGAGPIERKSVVYSRCVNLELELLFFLVLLFQMGHHRRVRKRCSVTQSAPVSDVTKQPAHDFSAAGLRQFGGEKYLVRPRNRPNLFCHMPRIKVSSSVRLDDPSTPALRKKTQMRRGRESCTSGRAGGLPFAGPSKGPTRKRVKFISNRQ